MAKKILFEIEIENVGASRRIEALREEIRRLNKEIKGVEDGSDEYRKFAGEIANAQIEIKDLKEQQKALNREFQAAKFPKDSLQGLRIEYSKLSEQLKVLSAAERQSPFGQSIIANAANVKKQIDGIEQSIGRFTGNVGNYRSAFASVSEILTGGLIGGGAVATINAVTNAFSKGLTALFEYEKGLDRLSAITGVTGQALGDLEKRAQSLTTIEIGDGKIVSTAQDIFEAFTLVGSARPELLEDAAALEEVTKQAIILSKASGDDLQTSVSAITTTLGQFKLGAGESVRVINELAAGSKLGASEIVDTTIALKKFGTTASVSNVSTAESIALIETLADRQLKGEEAGTQLRNILAKLAGSDILPKKALAELEEAGVSLDVLKDTTLPLITRLQELGKLQGNTSALTKVFGLENLAAAQIITQGIPKYQALLNGVQGTNEAYVQAGIQADNAAQRFQNLQNKGVNLLTNAFLGAEPAISAIIEVLDEVITLISDASGVFSDNAEEFTTLSFATLAFVRTAQTATVTTTAMTASQVSWAVALRGAAIAQSISTAATQAATAAMNALPLIAVAAGVYAIVKAFQAYEESASASEKATEAVADAQADIAKESAKETEAVRRNIETLKFEIDNKEARKKAIESLVSAYPDYLRGIDLEKASISELDRLQNQLTDSIIRSVAERRKAIATDEVAEKIIQKTLEIQELERKAPTVVRQEDVGQFVGATGIAQLGTENAAKKAITQLNDARAELIKLQDELEKTGQAFDDAFSLGGGERQLSQQQRNLLQFNSDLAGQLSGLADETSRVTDEAKKLDDATENSGITIQKLQDKISALKSELNQTEIGTPRFLELQKEIDKTQKQLDAVTTKNARNEINAQAGSIAFLKDQISKLQRQIEATAPGSPQLSKLIQQLDSLKGKLQEAEKALLQTTFKSLFGRELTAPTLDTGEQPELTILAELEPDAADKLKAQAQAVKDAVQAALQAVEFPVNVELTDAEKKLQDQREKGNEKMAEDQRARDQAEFEERKKLQELTIDNAITTGQNISDALTQIQANRLQQETDAQLLALDQETQRRIELANGNKTKIAAIEKDAAAKRAAIEKEAARQRKQIAVREAIINTALAITKALTGAPPPANLILAGVAAAAGAAQLAIINSQEFAEGGVVKRLQTGKVTEPQNAPRTAKGDTVLAYLAPGEMVLNEPQQNTLRSLFGQDAFAMAGVPGESATRRAGIPGFASGGVVGIVPQNGFAGNATTQQVTVDAKAEFSGDQIDTLGRDMGAIIAAEVSRQLRVGLAEGLFDANRRLEREDVLNQNRQG